MGRSAPPPPLPAGLPGPPLSAWTRLNVFQRLFLAWDRVHPQNAMQALVLSGREDPARWAAAWPAALAALGLGRIEVRGRRMRYVPVPPAESGAPAGPDPRPLESLLTEEMNRRFEIGAGLPFRPFLVESEGRLHAGISYFHWACDSVSVRALLHEWLARVHDPSRARTSPMRHPRGGYWRWFGPSAGTWRLPDAIRHAREWLEKVHRLPRWEADRFSDLSIVVSVHAAPAGMAARLPEAARARRATVNDLLVAAIVRAAERHLPLRRTEHRPDLAVGTIVDLRPWARRDLSDAFGMFLGYVAQSVAAAALADDESLIAAVARESEEHRRTGRALESPLLMATGLLASRFYEGPDLADWFRRRMPLVGGTSNVNMNRTWAAGWHPAPLLDYLRVSPVLAPLPFVVSATTLGDRFHLVVSRRPVLVPDAAHASVVSTILDRLTAWSWGARA